MKDHILEAQPRETKGSRAAKELRQSGRVPANVYGHNEPNVLVSLDQKEFTRFLHDGHRILSLKVGSTMERSVVKEVQYDALGSEIVHVDFTRISEDEAIEVEVPLELVGIPKGVTSGGILDVPQKEVLVSALPKDIPESITLQIETLEMGAQLRIKDLPAIPNCRYVGDEELVVLAVHAPRTEAEAAPSEGEASEPEVIQRKESDSEESSE